MVAIRDRLDWNLKVAHPVKPGNSITSGADFSDLLRLFNAGRVGYLVVGGYAVVQYAEPRFTADLDLWTGTDSRNARAVYEQARTRP